MKEKFTSTIAGASIFISLLMLLSRGLGFIREMIFANNFGIEKDFDLYLVGAVFPVTINTAILYIGQNLLVPAFQKVGEPGSNEAQKYYNQSFLLFSISGIILAFVLYLLSDIVIDFYMHSASVHSQVIASEIFKIFLITIPFSAGISMFSALLQTVFEFKYPAISILFLNISIILMLFLFTNSFGIYVIPGGYLIGTVFQFLYLLLKSRKYFKLNLILNTHDLSQIKSMFNSSVLIIIFIETVGQIYAILDRYFYGNISSGGIASLNYAYIIYYLPISIFSISLATAVFPKITKAISDFSKSEMERIYNESISVNIFIFMPIAFILFYFGEPLIKIAFERGRFNAESTQITYTALKCYSVSLIFYSVYSVLNKIFYSINLAKILLVITITGMIIKLVSNFILVEKYQQYGLATGTSISYIFFFLVSYLFINRKLEIKYKSLFYKDFLLYLANCLICLLITFIISNSLYHNNLISESLMMITFASLYVFNLFIINHKSFGLLGMIFSRFNLNRLIKSI